MITMRESRDDKHQQWRHSQRSSPPPTIVTIEHNTSDILQQHAPTTSLTPQSIERGRSITIPTGTPSPQNRRHRHHHSKFDSESARNGTATIPSNDIMDMQYTNPKHFNAYIPGGSTPSREKPRRTNAAATTTTMTTTTNENKAGNSNLNTNNRRNPDLAGDSSKPSKNNNSSSSSNNNNIVNAHHAQLTQRLSQYTRGSDRRQVLRSLMDPHLLPRIHALKSVWVEDIAAAEREAAGERAALNGVKFLQVKNSVGSGSDRPDARSTPVDSYFLQTLREICGHMCDMDGVDADPMALYGGLLLRLSRSVSERDALEVVTRWCCGKGELVALPLKRRHHHNTDNYHRDPSSVSASTSTANGSKLAVPIDLELYVESGNVHAKVTMAHELGVYRRTDLEAHGLKRELSAWVALVLASQTPSDQVSAAKKLDKMQYEMLASNKFTHPKPWIFMDADVVERINFGTGSSVRMLHLSVPEDKNSGYVKKWDY